MDSNELMSKPVSFLMSGPPFEMEIPASLHPIPQIVSPLDITGYGSGRDCAFVPGELDTGLSPELFSRADDLQGAEGRTVEVYPRLDGEMWFLRWPLSQGNVYVHIRVEDGFDIAQQIADNLHISESEGLPMVTPDAPLARIAGRDAGYGEVITFFEVAGEKIEGNVEVARPGTLARSAETINHSVVNLGKIDFMRGGPGNIDIRVSGSLEENEARAICDAMEQSLGDHFS